MVAERPILMHGRSIRGIRSGRKTETRRIIKPQPEPAPQYVGGLAWKPKTGLVLGWELGSRLTAESILKRCPYGRPGDVLWVREAWAMDARYDDVRPSDLPSAVPVEYRADEAESKLTERGRWRPSIHLPKRMSRLWLRVREVRVERIQDISAESVMGEGVEVEWQQPEPFANALPVSDFVDDFRKLWEDTNGPGAWKRNDWVWVIAFERIER